MRNQAIAMYGALAGICYVLLAVATWFIFEGEGMTVGNALAASVVYAFYIVIVFAVVALGSVVAFMSKKGSGLGPRVPDEAPVGGDAFDAIPAE